MQDKLGLFLLVTVLQLALLPHSLQQTQESQNAQLLLPQQTEQALTMLRTAGDVQLKSWAAKILDGPLPQPGSPSSKPNAISQSFQQVQPGNSQGAAAGSASGSGSNIGVQGGSTTQGVGGSQPFLPASNIPGPFLPAFQPTQPTSGSPSPAVLPFLPPLLPFPQNNHARANALASSTAAAMAALDAALRNSRGQGAAEIQNPNPVPTQQAAGSPPSYNMVPQGPSTEVSPGKSQGQSPVSAPSPVPTPPAGALPPAEPSPEASGQTGTPSPSPTPTQPQSTPSEAAAPSSVSIDSGSRGADARPQEVQTFAGIRQNQGEPSAGASPAAAPADSVTPLLAAVQGPSAAGPAEEVQTFAGIRQDQGEASAGASPAAAAPAEGKTPLLAAVQSPSAAGSAGEVQTFAGIRQNQEEASPGASSAAAPVDSRTPVVAHVQSPSAAGPAEGTGAVPATGPIAVQTAAAVRPSNEAPIRLSDVSAWPTDPFSNTGRGSSSGSWAGQEAGTHGTEPASEAVHQQVMRGDLGSLIPSTPPSNDSAASLPPSVESSATAVAPTLQPGKHAP